MSSRIEDYAIIADCRSVGLVSKDGSLDWLCLPRFDSDACFAALVGTRDNGRWLRATELRVEKLEFVDEVSQLLWFAMKDKQVSLVPLRHTDAAGRREKAELLRRHYRAAGAIVFLHVELTDDTSEFQSRLRARVTEEDDDFVIEIRGAVAIANTIAWVSEQLDPIALFLELSQRNPFSQALQYLLWGEGEIGVLVYQILVRYWHSTPEDDVRPLIFLVSE